MQSKKLRSVDDRQLPLSRGVSVVVPKELLDAKSTLMQAIALCIQLSGLEEKDIYLSLGIDAGHWTRMLKGDAHFPVNKLNLLMDMCGNEAPLMWQAKSRGYGLVVLQSEAERRLHEAQAELNEERKLNRRLSAMLTGRGET